LGELLRALGPELVVPPAPTLAEDVRRRIAAAPAPARTPWWRPSLAPRALRRALILAVALALVLAALAGAGRLGLPGITIVQAPPRSSATLPPTPSPAPSDAAPGAGSGLGRATTAEEARSSLGRALPTLPEPFGTPDAIYLDEAHPGVVSQVWGAAPGRPLADGQGVSLILTSLRATTDIDFIKKLADGGSKIDFTHVRGKDAFWIEGAHDVFVLAADGTTVIDMRVAGNVLLWSDGGLTYRLEGRMDRATATALAESMVAP
jgi:hypothetical protein